MQTAVNANPGGTVFCIEGEHRLSAAILPKAGDVFWAASGGSLNGSRVVTGWTASGSAWVASWTPARPPLNGVCATGTACQYSDDAFLDGVRLDRVLTASQVGPGKVYIDYAQHRIYLGDDPAGKTVEVAVAKAALDGNGNGIDNITVRGLVVEKFATPAQWAALDFNPGSGWTIERNDVRLNHGVGVESGTNSVVHGNHIHHQGQMGMTAYMSSGALVEFNEIDHNNTDGFDQAWESGGGKWTKTTSIIVRNNNVHDNYGTGIWFDGTNIDATIANNTVTGNDHHGIKYEISYAAVISGNQISSNGSASPYGGDGINIESSPNVEVFGNVLTGNAGGIELVAQSRGSGTYGPFELNNTYVHDNVTTLTAGYTGLTNYTTDTTYFTTRNNRFVHDLYTLTCGSLRFRWNGSTMTQTQWQNAGQDTTGTFTCL